MWNAASNTALELTGLRGHIMRCIPGVVTPPDRAPEALQHLPPNAKVLMTSGLLPAAAISVILNLALPQELD